MCVALPECPVSRLVLSTAASEYNTFEAVFGPQALDLQRYGWMDLFVVDPIDACTSIASAALDGKIAVIQRGACTFVEKVRHAQASNAIAAIIYNNVPGTVIMGGEADDIAIPALFVEAAVGEELLAAAAAGDALQFACGA